MRRYIYCVKPFKDRAVILYGIHCRVKVSTSVFEKRCFAYFGLFLPNVLCVPRNSWSYSLYTQTDSSNPLLYKNFVSLKTAFTGFDAALLIAIFTAHYFQIWCPIKMLPVGAYLIDNKLGKLLLT